MSERESSKDLKKILIIRLSSIGDIVLTTPVIRLLKKKYPDCQIDFVIKDQFKTLLADHPLIHQLYIFKKHCKSHSLKKIKQKIIRQKYDLIIDLHKNFRSFYLTFNCQAGKIVRYQKFSLRRFFLVKFKVNFFKQIIPVYLRYLIPLHQFGITYDGLGLDIYLRPETEQSIRTKYSAFFNNSYHAIIGIAPGASYLTKRWLPERFENVIHYFAKHPNIGIILFGNAQDRELIDSLNISTYQNVLKAAGELSIIESVALLNTCQLFITNDTGLMHLAAALNKKVVAIFGSTTEELGFFPDTTRNIVIQNNGLRCRPCSHVGRDRCPKKHFKCMKEISTDEVIQAVKTLLAEIDYQLD